MKTAFGSLKIKMNNTTKKALTLILAICALAYSAMAANLSSYPLAAKIEAPDTFLVTHYPLALTNSPQTYNLSVTNFGLTATFGPDTNNLYLIWSGNTEVAQATNEFPNYFGFAGAVSGGFSYTNANPNGYGCFLTVSNNGTGILKICTDLLNNGFIAYVLTSPDLQNWYYASNGANGFPPGTITGLTAQDNSLVATSIYHQQFTGWSIATATTAGTATNLAGKITASQVTGLTLSDTADAYDAQNSFQYGSSGNLYTLTGGGGAQAVGFILPNAYSATPHFRNGWVFSQSPLTNFTLTSIITGTNAGWKFTNNFVVRFNTNNGANGYGSYTAMNSNNVVLAGVSNQFWITNFTFSVPYGILTNTVGIQGQSYNNGSSNELFIRFILTN